MKKINSTLTLSPELEQLFAATPKLSEIDLNRLEKAGQELNNDPSFLAEVLKATFINEIYVGMEERGENKNTLSKKWGRTRQYLSNLLNEDKRVNFTIETMVELAHLLGKRVEIHVTDINPSPQSRKYRPPSKTASQVYCKPPKERQLLAVAETPRKYGKKK